MPSPSATPVNPSTGKHRASPCASINYPNSASATLLPSSFERPRADPAETVSLSILTTRERYSAVRNVWSRCSSWFMRGVLGFSANIYTCDSSIGDTPISMYRGNSYCVIVGKTRLYKIVSAQIISIELE